MTGTLAAPTPSKVQEALADLARRPQLATAQEIAGALGLPARKVYAMAGCGKLPRIKFGRTTVRFDAAVVATFLSAGGTHDKWWEP